MMAFSSGVMRYFYPRPPRGRRRENIQCEAKLLAISIHALREEGDAYEPFHLREKIEISIHALREEGDFLPVYFVLDRYNFYPRPPRGGRHPARHRPVAQQRFLSTPSARRATSISMSFAKAFLHFYPRPPRGGRPKTTQGRGHRHKFLSTPSARRATC